MVAYLFPGQGSQKGGMGERLFDQFPEVTERADQILGYSIKALCLERDGKQLNQTDHTQPALFVVDALSYLKQLTDTERRPDYVAGHSLGEYVALLVAGVFDFETGLRLVQKRGQLMIQATGGGMAAVIGMGVEQVEEVLRSNDASGIDVANYNSPTQSVISGLKDEIDRLQPLFQRAGARTCIRLNVSGAFHSRYMEPTRKEFEAFLDGFELSEPRIPVISNVGAQLYTKATAKKLLAQQITQPVNWTGVIRFLLAQGEEDFTGFGPGCVLTDLIKQIRNIPRS